MPNVLRSRGLVSRPDNMDETVLHTLGTFPLRQFIATCFHINVGALFLPSHYFGLTELMSVVII